MKADRARELLVAEREAIRRLWRIEEGRRDDEAAGDVFAELSSADQHPADAASETLEAESDATILAMAEDRLADVELAFARLAAGTYGTCETCGVVIDDDRLEARPAARFCITHERAWELRQIDLSVPAAPTGPATEVEPQVSLESLPSEDGEDTEVGPPAEETAWHFEPGHEALTPAQAEAVNAAEYDRQVTDEASREAALEDDVAETLREEEALGPVDRDRGVSGSERDRDDPSTAAVRR